MFHVEDWAREGGRDAAREPGERERMDWTSWSWIVVEYELLRQYDRVSVVVEVFVEIVETSVH